MSSPTTDCSFPVKAELRADNGGERVFPDAESLVELRVGDHERRQHADAVAVGPGLDEEKPVPESLFDHGRHKVGRRLLRLRIPDELDREHRAQAPYVADYVPALLPGGHPVFHGLADRPGALDEAL